MTYDEFKESIDEKECKVRIKQLQYALEERGAKVAWDKYGKRTTICLITEKDGWETVGVAYTKDPESYNLTIGKRWALEDAVGKLGQGRFFEHNSLGE